MNWTRLWAQTNMIMRGHVFNWLWRNRRKRRAVLARVLSEVIPNYLRRYLPAAAAVVESPVVRDDKNEKIWTLWLQGEDKAPPLVQACFRSVRKNCKQELVVLDEKSVRDYITLPDIIWQKRAAGKIGHAHFADICRVELLYEHGGIWLDSTGFATGAIPKWITDEDFFVYLVGPDGAFSYSFMQNCFIRARRGAYLLAAWRAMILDYWVHEDSAMEYFVHQLIFKTLVMNDARAKNYFAKMPHVDQAPTHALWWRYADKPFDKQVFNQVTSGAFFQKTTYRGTENPISGSFADVMINQMYKT